MLLGRRSAEEKLVCFLLGMQQRWARLGKPSVTVPLPMTRQDIADFLGLTIETVSRTFTRLAKEKTILIVPRRRAPDESRKDEARSQPDPAPSHRTVFDLPALT